MEEVAELASYLPLSFKTPKEQEYIEFLWDAFDRIKLPNSKIIHRLRKPRYTHDFNSLYRLLG